MIIIITLMFIAIALFMPAYVYTLSNNTEYIEWVYVTVPLWKAIYMTRNNNTTMISRLSYLRKEDFDYY